MSPRESDAALVDGPQGRRQPGLRAPLRRVQRPHLQPLRARRLRPRGGQGLDSGRLHHRLQPAARPGRRAGAQAASPGSTAWPRTPATTTCARASTSTAAATPSSRTPAAGVDEYQRAETVALVEASLGQLNERYRTALVLKDLQGLEPAEIAEVMEVSRPNADVLVHRARASFKAAFAKLAGDVPGAGRARPGAPAAQPAGGAAGDALVRAPGGAARACAGARRTRRSATACTSPASRTPAPPAPAGCSARSAPR